jgi:hypothetical protein
VEYTYDAAFILDFGLEFGFLVGLVTGGLGGFLSDLCCADVSTLCLRGDCWGTSESAPCLQGDSLGTGKSTPCLRGDSLGTDGSTACLRGDCWGTGLLISWYSWLAAPDLFLACGVNGLATDPLRCPENVHTL